MFMAIHERRSNHKLCLLPCALWRLKCIHLESHSIVASLSKKDRFPLHTKCNTSHLLSPTSTPMSIYLLWSFDESCTGSVERLLWKADLFDLNRCANCDVLTPEQICLHCCFSSHFSFIKCSIISYPRIHC